MKPRFTRTPPGIPAMTRPVFRALSRFSLLAAAAVPAALAAWALALAPASAAPAAPLEVDKAVLDAQAERMSAIKKVRPAVVAVCVQGGQGVGSGVVISPEGYALTNFHVVQATGPLMQAGLADGRFIALSGYGTESDKRRSRDAGFVEHLVKPLNPRELPGIIATAIADR